jgi:hypothetical protein
MPAIAVAAVPLNVTGVTQKTSQEILCIGFSLIVSVLRTPEGSVDRPNSTVGSDLKSQADLCRQWPCLLCGEYSPAC